MVAAEDSSRVVPEIDTRSFDLHPQTSLANGAAVLCLHGLTATPFEVRPVAEALAARGLRARGPVGAGHEGGARLLAHTPRRDWLANARSELAALRAEHDRVFLVGVSMGGLLSLRLAETERVDGLVVIGTPLALAPPVPQLLPLIRWIQPYRKKNGSDIQDPIARARHPSIPAMPMASVAELIELQSEVIPELSKIEAPILVAHGGRDRTARPRDAQRIFDSVSSVEKELFYLERSGHIATVDYDGPALARATADFLGRR